MSRAGSVDWLCFPRFDSPSVFGRILDDEAGHWSIHPTADAEVDPSLRRRHDGARDHVSHRDRHRRARRRARGRAERARPRARRRRAVRARCDRSRASAARRRSSSPTRPRPEYGLVYPLFDAVDGGVYAAWAAPIVLALSSPIPIDVDDHRRHRAIHGRARVRRSSSRSSTGRRRRSRRRFWPADEIGERLADTTEAWHTWSEIHQAYEGPWHDLVHHSGRVLYALTYYPTGAICAAPTTSLPETPGGSRNWDYRYAWVRDASFTIQALWVAACPDEAKKFFDFMSGAAAVAGAPRRRPPDHVRHRRRARPHRTRAAAPHRLARQRAGARRQRCVEPAPARRLRRAARRRVPTARPARQLAPSTRQFLADLADTAAARWQEQDQGIWEVRGEPRDFLYSKLMCWVALDRAIMLADRFDADRPRRRLDSARATRSRTRSSPAAGTRRPVRSRSRSAPTTSTRRT